MSRIPPKDDPATKRQTPTPAEQEQSAAASGTVSGQPPGGQAQPAAQASQSGAPSSSVDLLQPGRAGKNPYTEAPGTGPQKSGEAQATHDEKVKKTAEEQKLADYVRQQQSQTRV